MTEQERLTTWAGIAARCFPGDPDRQSDALTWAWWMLEFNDHGADAEQIGYNAVRRVREGRELPGLSANRPDALDRLSTHAILPDLADRRAERPDQIAAGREHWRAWVATLDAQEASLALAFVALHGVTAESVGRSLAVTGRTVWKIRARLRRRWGAITRT